MEDVSSQKSEGDQAFKEGRLDEAHAIYTAALEEHGPHVPTLCNRSLAALKLGRPNAALQDAEMALQELAEQGEGVPPPPAQLAKAFHRKAEALLGLGRLLDGIRAYRQGLVSCGGSPELHAALRLAAEELPVGWLAKYWSAHVEAAQSPHPLSARDGRLIKPVRHGERLPPPDLTAQLEAALYPLQDEARDLLCEAWAGGRRPGKAEAAFFRGAAYLAAGSPQQALKDARFALAYGPRLDEGTCGALVVASSGSGGSFAPGGGAAPAPIEPAGGTAAARSAWPAALALLSAAHEGLADNVLAALAAQRAHELDPENVDYAEAVERLIRRIPEACAAALQAGGAAGLQAYLAGEREAAKPEFLRHRPKYYYYYEWMKKRLAAQYPALPEPVTDKLLALEANELDMVLQYPAATQITVERLLDVYEQQGSEALEGYAVPLLSWQDYQAIREGAAPAALEGGAFSGSHLLEGGAAGGKGGEAAGERAGGVVAGSGRHEEAVAAEPSSDDVAGEAGSVDVEELCELD